MTTELNPEQKRRMDFSLFYFSGDGAAAQPGGTLDPQGDTDQQLAYIVSDIQDFWAEAFPATMTLEIGGLKLRASRHRSWSRGRSSPGSHAGSGW